MALASPIDYAATRRALVRAMVRTMGLPSTKILREQGQGPIQPRPALPFATFKYSRTSIRNGRDALVAVPSAGDTMWNYVGERGIGIEIQTFGRDQDEAYGLAMAFQMGIATEPATDILSAGGLCLWSIGDVTDITALMNTGFEGRAMVECEMWLGVSQLVDLGAMETVDVEGNLQDDGRKSLHISVHAQLADP